MGKKGLACYWRMKIEKVDGIADDPLFVPVHVCILINIIIKNKNGVSCNVSILLFHPFRGMGMTDSAFARPAQSLGRPDRRWAEPATREGKREMKQKRGWICQGI